MHPVCYLLKCTSDLHDIGLHASRTAKCDWSQDTVLRICLHRERKAFIAHPQILSLFSYAWDPHGYANWFGRPPSVWKYPFYPVYLLLAAALHCAYLFCLVFALILRPVFPIVYRWTQVKRGCVGSSVHHAAVRTTAILQPISRV